MTQTTYPTGSVPATVNRWARMARMFASTGIVGASAQNAYGATVSGLTLTIGRGTTGVAEAWVRAFFHVHDAADWVLNVPANGNATQARVDRVVLRWDPAREDVQLTHLIGTPAASPTAPPLVQDDGGVWDLPLWRFTVPANNGAPLTGLVDDRVFVAPGGANEMDADERLSRWLPARPGVAALVATGGAPRAVSRLTYIPELRLFIACATTGRIYTSPDGDTWTERILPNTGTVNAVVWVPSMGQLFAVQAGSNAATSPDGITWTARTTPPPATFADVVWAAELGLFVGLTSGAGAYTSPDGLNWTARTLPSTVSNWTRIVWAPELGLFAAVAYNGSTTSYPIIATSPDGITWTTRLSAASWYLYGLCWSPELRLFVAVGYSGAATPRNSAMYVSADGITWQTRNPPTAVQQLYAVTWCRELGHFVAVANIGPRFATTDASSAALGPRIYTSPDGYYWTPRGPWLHDNVDPQAVAFAGDRKLVVIGGSSSSWGAPHFVKNAT
jgi:hypothetical protein